MRARATLLLLLALGVVGLIPPTATAATSKQPRLAVSVTPATPQATDTLSVTFTAGRMPPGWRYVVGIGANAAGAPCTTGYMVQLKAQRPGSKVTVRLTPSARGATGRIFFGAPLSRADRFCAGPTAVTVDRFDPDLKSVRLGRRVVSIAKDPGYPAESTDTATRVTVLEGSTVTVTSAGRQTRTLGLGGVLDGVVPGKIQLNRDIAVTSLAGALHLRTLAPDTACAGDAYRTAFGSVPAATSLTLLQSGAATLTLALDAAAPAIAGCNEAMAAGTTIVTLAGRVSEGGLTKLALTGTASGAQLAPGITADLTFNLLVNVDLSGGAAG